ncbi:MAG: thioesterase [Desulfobacteraceae bacterium]|nr:thioesterase [Desulfobacteraceae bacterium]
MNETHREAHHLKVQIYYEDTDHSGVVYHANYLKYFARARETILGINTIAEKWYEQESTFAVYKVNINYHDGVVFGDQLDIKTTWKKDGDYRVVFYHEAWKTNATKPAVTCEIEVVWLGPNKNVLPIPDFDIPLS